MRIPSHDDAGLSLSAVGTGTGFPSLSTGFALPYSSNRVAYASSASVKNPPSVP